MPQISECTQSKLASKPAMGLLLGLTWLCAFHLTSAHAEDAAAFRARVIKEVLEEVSDVDLAKQIVEIRIQREFLKPSLLADRTLSQEVNAGKTPASLRVPIRQPVQAVFQPASAAAQK